MKLFKCDLKKTFGQQCSVVVMDKHVEIHRDGTLATHPPYLGDDVNLLHDSGVDQVSKVKDVAQLSSFLTHWLEGLSIYVE